MSKLKIGVAQITSTDVVEQNLHMMLEELGKLSTGQVEVVFFPENCLYMRLQEGEKISGLEISHAAFSELSEWAKKNNTALHLGSIPYRDSVGLHNSSIWISKEGEVRPSYTKVHLFDIELEGQKPIRESDVFRPGSGPQMLKLNDWHIGQTICYDVRFSELFSSYAAMGAELITVPAAFLVKTGMAHWEILLRARAIESQCYIVASAQSGLHQSERGKRETYGHSLVVDPWGHKVLEMVNSPEIATLELDLSEVRKVRGQIPMKNHRRGPFKA